MNMERPMRLRNFGSAIFSAVFFAICSANSANSVYSVVKIVKVGTAEYTEYTERRRHKQTRIGVALYLVAILVLFSSVPAQRPDIFKRKVVEARMLQVAKWQLANPNHELYDWTNGAFYAGVFAAYETTHSKDLWNAMIEMGEKNKWGPGKRFDHADDIVINQTYLDLYRITKDKKMLQPTIDVVERIKKEPSQQAEQRGIIWWWCDALFMAPPTLAKLASITGDRSYLELNDKFFQQTYDRLYDKQERL